MVGVAALHDCCGEASPTPNMAAAA